METLRSEQKHTRTEAYIRNMLITLNRSILLENKIYRGQRLTQPVFSLVCKAWCSTGQLVGIFTDRKRAVSISDYDEIIHPVMVFIICA